MQYEYDAYGNMTYREDGNWGNDEDFEYDNLNRPQVLRRGDITYDGKGNITAHDAAGAFSYASSKPYALSQIALAVTDFPTATQTITYNSMNRPDTISEGSLYTLLLKLYTNKIITTNHHRNEKNSFTVSVRHGNHDNGS